MINVICVIAMINYDCYDLCDYYDCYVGGNHRKHSAEEQCARKSTVRKRYKLTEHSKKLNCKYMDTKSDAPSSSKEFDKQYSSKFAHWLWGDTRIPKELKELVEQKQPKTSLELGCGLGRFSAYLAEQGISAIGIDFSSVAIKKANERLAEVKQKPQLLVGNVTNLVNLTEPFDVAIDIGCFHCLAETAQKKYVSETYRLLKPNSTLLIWALDSSPSDIKLSPKYIEKVFGTHFFLERSKFSRRRIISSHWYWLIRKD